LVRILGLCQADEAHSWEPVSTGASGCPGRLEIGLLTKIELGASGAPAGQPTAPGDNPDGARAKSCRSRVVPVGELLVFGL